MDDGPACASHEIIAARTELAAEIAARQRDLHLGAPACCGVEGREAGARDAGYTLSYLAAAIGADDPVLFASYLDWASVLFASISLPPDVLPVGLQIMREVLCERLSPGGAAAACAVLDAGLRHLPSAPTALPSLIPDTAPLADLAGAYLDALLRGDRSVASSLVLGAVDAGADVKDAYLRVFQPVQLELGRLWQTNRISVAQEHFCTAVTQLVMSQLYPRIFTTQRNGRRLVATCVSGELHEIGMRMVADFFELDGWDTYYLGANMPTESVVRAVCERGADVLAISATMTFHVSAVAEMLAEVRRCAADGLKVLVGGYPFNLSSRLWRQVGADGYAPDALGAVEAANRLTMQNSAVTEG
jgi:MerR family transcriptional regulator, light-induced transcriptional regulator